jgi:methylaspartate ammonia-lyase
MSKVGQNLLTALKLKYMSEIQSATATLHIYINNPVGIGEHPQHLEEMDKLIDTIATNQDKMDALRVYIDKIIETNP